MTIYVVCDTFGFHRGGIERHAEGLTSGLRHHGFVVELLSTRTLLHERRTTPEDYIIIEGVHRHALVRLLNAESTRTPESLTIFTHGSYYGFCHLWKLAKQGFYGGLARDLGTYLFDLLMTKTLLRRFGTVAVMTDMEMKDVVRVFRLPARRVFVSPNFSASGSEGESGGIEAPLVPQEPFVFAIGRIESRKNFHSILPALDGLGVSFVLAGTDEGGLARVLRSVRKHPGVRFTYLGVISEPAKNSLISRAVATILPSHLEGVPFSVVESLELRIPAIVTSTSYVPAWDGVYFCTPEVRSIRESVIAVLKRQRSVTPTQIPDDRTVAGDLLRRWSILRGARGV
jgi:glycosyltransferase involved in cell wall biosynthesis